VRPSLSKSGGVYTNTRKEGIRSKSKHSFILYVKQPHVSTIYSHHQAEHRTTNKKKTTIQSNKTVGTRSHLTSMSALPNNFFTNFSLAYASTSTFRALIIIIIIIIMSLF
jgi:hypothetical protein